MHSQQTLTASPGSPHSRQAMDSEEGHGGSVSFRVAPLQQTFNEHAAVGTTGHFHPQQPPQAMDERPVKFSKDQLRESVARWLKENYKLSYDRSIEKKVLYEEYLALCRARNWEPTTPAAFGRIVRKAFPWVSSCRRGSRGNTSHHYTHLQSKAEAESCLQQNDGQSSFSFSAVPPSGAASFTQYVSTFNANSDPLVMSYLNGPSPPSSPHSHSPSPSPSPSPTSFHSFSHTASARYNSDDMNVEVKEEDMMFKERRHMMPPPQHHHHLSNGTMQPRHQDEDDDDAVSPRASAHHNSAMGYSWDPAAYEAQNALGGLGGGFQLHHQPPQEGSLPQQQQFSMFQQQSGYPYNLPNSWPQERQAPYTTTIAATMTAGSPCATGVGGVGAYTNAATSFSAPSHHTTSSSLHPLGHYSRSASSVFPDLGSAQESELEFRKGFGSAPQKHSFSSSYHHHSSAQQRHHSLHPHHNQGRQYIEAFQRSQQ
ncbi:Cellulose-binding protein, partial [Balamuthia mandrillaris]